MQFIEQYLQECQAVLARLDRNAVAQVVDRIERVRNDGGRLFILGVGGSAANAAHAVNDFRKLAGIEAYAPTDNVSELTARTNDEGWRDVFAPWLETSRLSPHDCVFVLSVGGGSVEHDVSANIVGALQYARQVGAGIVGIVSRDGGYTARVADACVIVPVVNATNTTPHAEAFQAVVWHLLVSHPRLKRVATKWEQTVTTNGRAVFLDRDGVLNRVVLREGRPFPPRSLAEFVIPDEARRATRRLADAGFKLICVTNQPDVARGTQARDAIEQMHAHLRAELPLDDLLVCYNDGDDPNRKPNPGMLLTAARQHNIDLAASFLVGDRWKDIEAGHRAGCRTLLLDHAYDEPWQGATPHHRITSLDDAVDIVLHESQPHVARDRLAKLRVQLFADGADIDSIRKLADHPFVRGFTTNPTLMRKAGVSDYEAFAREALAVVGDRPISFEVFADEFDEMERQAIRVASWGDNVNVKIPITNTRGESALPLVHRLVERGLRVNVTATMTLAQVEAAADALAHGPGGYVSLFAGRLADSGRDPVPIVRRAAACVDATPGAELIWASPREALNVFQADAVGCHVITLTQDLLRKLDVVGRDPDMFSRDTVQMFASDAAVAGYAL
jgi:transaldolase